MKYKTAAPVKTCTRCNLPKPLSAFGKNRRKRDGLDVNCRGCTNERMREAYAANPTPKIAATHAYHLANPEWSKKRLRAHHEAHAVERYERSIERGKNPAVRAKRRESTRRSEQRRRAVKAASAVVESITAEQLEQRLKKFNGRCWICRAKFGAKIVLHWDHYKPLAHGGLHVLRNLRPACDLCNVRKSALWPLTPERIEKIRREVVALRKSAEARNGGA